MDMPEGMGQVVGRTEGRKVRVAGEHIMVKLSHEDTAGAFGLWEELTQPEGGPPPHVHHREDEGFYVIEGEVEFHIGDRTLRALPGGFVFAPRDVPHFFKNIGARPSRMMVMAVPAGFEHFLLAADGLDITQEAGMVAMRELGRKFGLEFLPPERKEEVA